MEEFTVMESKNRTIRLTNKHIRREGNKRGGTEYEALPLAHVSGVLFKTRNYPLLAVLGGILLLVAIGMNKSGHSENEMLTVAGAGLALLIAFFMMRTSAVEIISQGGAKVKFETSGMSHDQIKTFAEAVLAQAEEARKAKA